MTSKTVATQQLVESLKPFAALGGPQDGLPAYQDLEDDVVVYKNSGQCITAGDVRRARDLLHLVARQERGASDTTPRRGCQFDTDGDGNCPLHPKGCPPQEPTRDA